MAMDFLTILGRRSGEAAAGEVDAAVLLGALGEPAAICAVDGAILAANPAWREIVGPARRLPRSGGGLFEAFLRARGGGQGEAVLRCGKAERAVGVSRLGADHFLLRVSAAKIEPPAARRPSKRHGGFRRPAPFFSFAARPSAPP